MHALRRYKLRALLRERFNDDRGAFLEKTGISKGRLSQLLDPDEPFGDVAARNLETKLELDPGYFDTMDARTLHFALAFERLPANAKANWERLVGLLSDPPPPST